MSVGEEILKAVDIHREFDTPEGPIQVLRGIDVTIARGEMVAVTGVSRVGKSTLLHVLGGLDKPTTGDVFICSERLAEKSQDELARLRNKKIGFVFQFHYLLDDFNALENVSMPLLISGRSKAEATREGEQLLALVGLTSRRSHLPRQLSGGEQQRVAVARALANDPEIVLADEPSGNLDTDNGNRLHDLLFHLNTERSTTFLIATHNRDLASRCQRELKIVDGQIRQ